jgi:hypothetical protein
LVARAGGELRDGAEPGAADEGGTPFGRHTFDAADAFDAERAHVLTNLEQAALV